jgi:hypothetical protein
VHGLDPLIQVRHFSLPRAGCLPVSGEALRRFSARQMVLGDEIIVPKPLSPLHLLNKKQTEMFHKVKSKAKT